MELIGYGLAVLIGLLLSLLGGGGSILTVPVLVYVFLIDPKIATAYSLLIVGVTSLIASVNYMRKGLASPKTALFFSFPSFIMVFLTRKYLMPLIPEELFRIGNFVFSKDTAIMSLFAVLMLLASSSMIRNNRKEINDLDSARNKLNYPLVFSEGLLVGILTGIVGVGGGFLIIPVLTAIIRLPMKLAVGTSLMIIAINSIIGFMGDIGKHEMDWPFLTSFIGLAVIGVGIGLYLSKFISNKMLKPGFGVFILIMGCWILLKELLLK